LELISHKKKKSKKNPKNFCAYAEQKSFPNKNSSKKNQKSFKTYPITINLLLVSIFAESFEKLNFL
jgi:hypothetical protein